MATTRTDLLTALAYRLNKTPPPNMDSTTEARLAGFINQRQRRLLTMPGLKRLRQATISFDSVADQANYGLPNVAKIERIYDQTNERVLYEMSQQDQRLIDPRIITGTPEAVIWTGRQVVASQPSDASSLFVKSSSAADTSQTVYVEGITTSGNFASGSVTLTGTTAINVNTGIVSWTRVDKFYLSATCAGFESLLENSGSVTTLAQIPIGELVSVYIGFQLWPTPGAAITYTVDITRNITDLVRGTDEAALPDDFMDLLILGPLADEYQHLNDERWTMAVTEYKERENQLKYWLAELPIGKPWSLSRGWQRPSQLGGWFPAGT